MYTAGGPGSEVMAVLMLLSGISSGLSIAVNQRRSALNWKVNATTAGPSATDLLMGCGAVEDR